jgi:hypothetical protein
MGRLVVVMISFLAAVVGFGGSSLAELRQSPERPDVFEIGDPVMIGKTSLEHEMRMNSNLAAYIENYGWPDYAEIQEVQVQYPYAAYEVRIYYLRRNSYLAYGRVIVAPSVYDYGIRKYEGTIRPDTLDRLLTAVVPADEAEEVAVLEVDEQPIAVVPVDSVPPAGVPGAEVVEAESVRAGMMEGEVVEAEVVEAEVVEAAPGAPVEVAAASQGSGRTLEEIIQRLEAAAERAAVAANAAEEASIAATNSADRATSVLERVASGAGE